MTRTWIDLYLTDHLVLCEYWDNIYGFNNIIYIHCIIAWNPGNLILSLTSHVNISYQIEMLIDFIANYSTVFYNSETCNLTVVTALLLNKFDWYLNWFIFDRSSSTMWILGYGGYYMPACGYEKPPDVISTRK